MSASDPDDHTPSRPRPAKRGSERGGEVFEEGPEDARPEVEASPEVEADPAAAESGAEHGGVEPGPQERTVEPGAEMFLADAVDPVSVRQAPRYGRFVLAGIVLGGLLSLIVAALPIGGSRLSGGDLAGLLFLALGSLGALLGAGLALWLDRRSVRRRRTRLAERRAAAEHPGRGQVPGRSEGQGGSEGSGLG